MRHITYTFLSFLIISNFSNAQPADVESANDSLDFLDDSEEALGSASNKAEADANAWLVKKQEIWELDGNTDFVGAVGSASIGGTPTSPSYHKGRVEAYDIAMMNLKAAIAKELAARVKSETILSYSKPRAAASIKSSLETKQATKPEDFGMLDKAKLIIHHELDKELDNRGIQAGTPAAEKLAEAEIERRYSKSIGIAAQTEVGGLYTAKTFEEAGTLAVVGVYSDKMKQLQRAILSQGDAPKAQANPSSPSLGEWARNLKIKDLYASHGVQLKADKYGDINLIAYSQWPASSNTALSAKMAFSEAEAMNFGHLRAFVGELMVVDSGRDQVSSLKEFGQLEKVSQNYQVDSAYTDNIRAKAEELGFPGIKKLRTWQIADKRSGVVICGVISGWNISNAERSVSERARNESIGASKGGQGITGKSRLNGTQSQQDNRYDPNKSGSTRVESLESEEF